MSPEMVEKVLERLGTTDGTTLVLKREAEGKIRVTSTPWEEVKVLGRATCLRSAMLRAGSISHARRASRTSGSRRSNPTTRMGRADQGKK
jgi:hypothetical protein